MCYVGENVYDAYGNHVSTHSEQQSYINKFYTKTKCYLHSVQNCFL